MKLVNGVLKPLSKWDIKDQAQRRAQAKEIAAAELKAEITSATQAALDDFARTRDYDNILSASTYATSTVPQFAAEGQYCVQLRDATWAALYQIMTEIENGTRPMPTGFADIADELPTSTADWLEVF